MDSTLDGLVDLSFRDVSPELNVLIENLKCLDDTGLQVFIFSSAGKPIWCLRGSEEKYRQLISVSVAVIAMCDSKELPIKSLVAEDKLAVLQRYGEIVLMAIYSDENSFDVGMNLMLEYLYKQIVFFLTEKFQDLLVRNPGYDMRPLLTGAHETLKAAAFPDFGDSRWACKGLNTLWMDPKIRDKITSVLKKSIKKLPISVLAIAWIAEGGDIIGLVHGSDPTYCIDSTDMLLFVNFMNTQPGLRDQDSWIPVCFQSISSSGYIHAFVGFFETENILQKSTLRRSYIVVFTAENLDFGLFVSSKKRLVQKLHGILGENLLCYVGYAARSERKNTLNQFCSWAKILHFAFVFQDCTGKINGLNQVLSSAFGTSIESDTAKAQIWKLYDKSARQLSSHTKHPSKDNEYICLSGTNEVVSVLSGDAWRLHACFDVKVIHNDVQVTTRKLAQAILRDKYWLFYANR